MGKEKIILQTLEEIMGDRFGRYSKYIIQDRALPDARDGLKPVQRRILYSMYEENNTSDKPYRKAAKAVGSVMGNYHPHGDSSIYEALVRMSQDWKLRYPLIDMHGNKGSIDGDPAAAMRYCLTGDALILTDHGLVRLDSLVKDSKLNSDNDIDILVESVNGVKNKADKFFNSGIHDVFEVRLKNGLFVKGTSNHPLLVVEKDERGRPCLQWKLIKDINKGDLIVVNKRLDQIESSSDKVNKNVARLLGLLVSEGFISGKNLRYYRIGLNNKDKELVDEAERILKEEFGHLFNKVSRSKNGSTDVVCVHSKKMHDYFVENFDMKTSSYEKVIPRVILESSREIQAEFLRYLFEGDGSVFYNNKGSFYVSYTSYSEELINQLQILLLSFGIVSYKYKDGKGKRLRITGFNNIVRFKEKIGFVSKRKNRDLEKGIELYKYNTGISGYDYIPFIKEYIRNKYKDRGYKVREFLDKNNFDRINTFNKNEQRLKEVLEKEDFDLLKHWLDKDYIYIPVEVVRHLGKDIVYSVRVSSDCHSFTANGIINHNTEARLSPMAEELLNDIEKDTVDFVPNFDDSAKEPTVLPASFPNLLVNGSNGIAAGYATDIPPHNLIEVIDAVIYQLMKPNCKLEELLEIIKGPDFPGGGIILGTDGIKKAYETGKGKIVIRAKVEVEEAKSGKKNLVITELPYEVNKANLVKKIDMIRAEKKIDGIVEVRDESDREGIRIVVELKKDIDADVILSYLYKNTELQINYNFNMIAIDKRTPKLMGLKDLLQAFIDHRIEVVTRRTKNELEKAKRRLHIVEGLIKAVSILNKVIKTIKESENKSDAKKNLENKYGFTVEQSEAIVTLQLYRLSNTDIVDLQKEEQDLRKLIEKLEEILGNEKKLKNVIKKELEEVKKYGDERRTEIREEVEEVKIDMTQVIPEEEVVVCVTRDGYVKRSSMRSFNSSGGESEVGLKDGDEVLLISQSKTTNKILIFTDRGNYVYLPVYQIEDAKWKDVGQHISTLVSLEDGERFVKAFDVEELTENKYVVIVKDNAKMKRTVLKEYEAQRNGKSLMAIKCDEDEKVIDVFITDGGKDVVMISEKGYGMVFNEDEVAVQGIRTSGMNGMYLGKDSDDKLKEVYLVDNEEVLKEIEKKYGEIPRVKRGYKGKKLKQKVK